MFQCATSSNRGDALWWPRCRCSKSWRSTPSFWPTARVCCTWTASSSLTARQPCRACFWPAASSLSPGRRLGSQASSAFCLGLGQNHCKQEISVVDCQVSSQTEDFSPLSPFFSLSLLPHSSECIKIQLLFYFILTPSECVRIQLLFYFILRPSECVKIQLLFYFILRPSECVKIQLLFYFIFTPSECVKIQVLILLHFHTLWVCQNSAAILFHSRTLWVLKSSCYFTSFSHPLGVSEFSCYFTSFSHPLSAWKSSCYFTSFAHPLSSLKSSNYLTLSSQSECVKIRFLFYFILTALEDSVEGASTAQHLQRLHHTDRAPSVCRPLHQPHVPGPPCQAALSQVRQIVLCGFM